MNRRQFLSSTAGGLAGAGAVSMGFQVPDLEPGRKNLVHLFMKGGMSHLETFDPKPNSASEKGAPKPIGTNIPGIHISKHFPMIARRMDRITLVRSMSHSSMDHFSAQSGFLRGIRSILGCYDPFGNLPESIEDNRCRFSEEMTKVPERIMSGENFIGLELDGWDSHTSGSGQVARQSAILDAALSRLLDDLEKRDLLNDTVVVVATEFGRTSKINAYGGRNHHPGAFSCLIAGGGIRGGRVIGETGSDGMQVIGEKIGVKQFNEGIASLLSNDVKTQFSENILSI